MLKEKFQSTLPHGSDARSQTSQHQQYYFNPRSLTGATSSLRNADGKASFQSTLPHGSDVTYAGFTAHVDISIHAPSRERRNLCRVYGSC